MKTISIADHKKDWRYPYSAISLKHDSVALAEYCGLKLDPWQEEVLDSEEKQLILNCSRQSGKSTITALLGLKHAMFNPSSLVLIVSNVYSQSIETFRKLSNFYRLLERPIPPINETLHYLELRNGSRIITLSGKNPGNIRGYSATLLIVDEAAQVPDLTYDTARPMLAVSKGNTILLSTPHGRDGFFWDAWQNQDDWHKIRVTWKECPRLTAEWIAQERKMYPEWFFRQEYECSFEEGNQSIINPEAIREAFVDRPGRNIVF